MTLHWPYAADLCLREIRAPAIGSFTQVKEKNGVYLTKRLTINDPFEGLWSVGTRFRH